MTVRKIDDSVPTPDMKSRHADANGNDISLANSEKNLCDQTVNHLVKYDYPYTILPTTVCPR